MEETFRCDDCELVKPAQHGGGTGYADTRDGKRICYACCSHRDVAEMTTTGKAVLYLVQGPRPFSPEWIRRGPIAVPDWKLTNWPGSLTISVHTAKLGRHNIARRRYDVWFTGPDGKPWYGVQYGDNTQICRCRRVRG